MSIADRRTMEKVKVRNCADLGDRATADLVENDEIDVLFNMYWNFKRGYGVFEEKPAKIIKKLPGIRHAAVRTRGIHTHYK